MGQWAASVGIILRGKIGRKAYIGGGWGDAEQCGWNSTHTESKGNENPEEIRTCFNYWH